MERNTRCNQCGEEKKIVGRGLCAACYHRERRRRVGALQGKEQAAGADFIVRVDFEPMAYLLEKLRKRASVELRDVNRQILWELNKSMGVQA
jgi:ribosomal protein L37E